MRSPRPAMPWLLVALLLVPSLAHAQWDPANGVWGKEVSSDVRIMTYNVKDCLCSSNFKVPGDNWEALARIIASVRPDVLILQETADNSGNGTGAGVDSLANLATTFDLFLHGGNDPFHGNAPVTAYVQLYAPGYDLPYFHVSSETDGFNRNAVLSRFPFGDVNGDGRTTHSDIGVAADLWAPGGDGGIRGYEHVELDLPDGTYAGDLVVGNCHLKAGGAPSDHAQRITAAKNIAYFIDAQFNGLGTAGADPNGAVLLPDAPDLPAALTPFVTGGDWNEDEEHNGAVKGPADWIMKAALADPASDGTDRDRTDMVFDQAADLFTGNTNTTGANKLDYIVWQDSIAARRRAFLFDTTALPAAAFPPEVAPFGAGASFTAADHRPVVLDLILPLAGSAFVDLGPSGIGGALGEPVLAGDGDLTPGSAVGFQLACTGAQPFALGYFFLSDQTNPFTPFFGGTFYPLPILLQEVVGFDAAGELHVALALPAGFPGGTSLTLQFFFVDASGPFGVTGSNGLRLDVP